MMIPTIQLGENIIKDTLKFLDKDKGRAKRYLQDTLSTTRETYGFGYDYFALAKGDNSFVEIPSYLKDLCKQCINDFGSNYQLGSYKEYLNVIISIYKKGYQLEPHVDVDLSYRFAEGTETSFYFGENILGVVLKADSKGSFYIINSSEEALGSQEKRILKIEEKPGTAFLLTGPLRRYPYFHGVDKVECSRISVTYRTVKFSP